MAVQAKKKVKMFFGAIGAGNWEKLNKFIILPLVIFRAVAQFFSSGRAMFQIHTNKDSESVRGALRRLIAGNNCASGQINGDTFLYRTGAFDGGFMYVYVLMDGTVVEPTLTPTKVQKK